MPSPRNVLLFPLLASVSLLLSSAAAAQSAAPTSLTEQYRETAGALIGAALTDDEGWEKLTYLTTVIGNRLSGSPQLEQAIQWASEQMGHEGFDKVTLQPVKVPHWVRGKESAQVVAPHPRELRMLGLGNSIGTPPEGITAPIVVVRSFDALKALNDDAVKGKIVVYAVPWEGYGKTVQYRSRGASEAARKGAVAALVRSATGNSLATPHTGAMRYAKDAPKIPTAAITPEDADWMGRMAESGRTVTVKLTMEAKMLPDADSHNVIAEITGSEFPDEVVVMGGHFDSWDVGQGAHDDGASCMAAWQALTLIKKLGLRPKRTLRVVLWTNEENGLRGGRAYRKALGDQVKHHVAAIEMDGGCERPVGFGASLGGSHGESEEGSKASTPAAEKMLAKLREIGALLEGIGAGSITSGGGGADIGPLMREGVPGLALRTVMEHYFDWHHTDADTLDKVDPLNLRRATAMLAVMGFVLADMPGRLTDQ